MDDVRNQAPRLQAVRSPELSADGKLVLPAVGGYAILTCMDARIDVTKLAALREGDAHLIRNAGARASDDAIRSLMMSYTALGTREWFVVHHSHCGMALFSDETSQELLAETLNAARQRKERVKRNDAQAGAVIDWVALRDERHSLIADVERIRKHPLVPADVAIYGYIYQTETGRLVAVQQAQLGRT